MASQVVGVIAAHGASDNGHQTRPRLQTEWLDRAKGHAVTLHLVNGKGLTGKLAAFDQFCIALQTAEQREPVLVFKHAVACVILVPPK